MLKVARVLTGADEGVLTFDDNDIALLVKSANRAREDVAVALLLLKTGWSFNEFLPDRRSVADRRTWPRLTERRRWWTDGLLRRYIPRRARNHR